MKTSIIFISNNRLRGIKPSNELNYFQIDGKPLWYHLSQLFDRQHLIHFFVDKKIKGQPQLDNVIVEIKKSHREIICEIYNLNHPDKLIIIDDSITFNTSVAQTIENYQETGVLFNLGSLVDKLSLSGIINKSEVANITYGINKKEKNIVSCSNIYILNRPSLDRFIEMYEEDKYKYYAVFELFNELIGLKYKINAVQDKSHKIISIKNNTDLERSKKLIHENNRNFIKR